jgi:hypothetical protein
MKKEVGIPETRGGIVNDIENWTSLLRADQHMTSKGHSGDQTMTDCQLPTRTTVDKTVPWEAHVTFNIGAYSRDARGRDLDGQS